MRVALLNGRLQRWPPFAKGSLSGPGMEVTVVLAYEDFYRALAGDATIPGDRPVRPGSEKNRTSQGLPQQGGWRAQFVNPPDLLRQILPMIWPAFGFIAAIERLAGG